MTETSDRAERQWRISQADLHPHLQARMDQRGITLEMTKVKIEYDPARDLLYLWFGTPGAKAARTVTVVPGLHADLDTGGKLIGIEVLDASEILGTKLQFEVDLPISRLEQPLAAD
jgi:uncharacterized protein YuzE